MKAIRKHFPERGTYFCPSLDSDPKVTDEKFRKGPLAFAFLLTPQSRPVEDLLSLIGLSLITVQMRQVRSAMPTYRSRVLFAGILWGDYQRAEIDRRCRLVANAASLETVAGVVPRSRLDDFGHGAGQFVDK